MSKVRWTVTTGDGYVRVAHSKRGLICAATWDGKRLGEIAFLLDSDRCSNMIRMPAMTALQNWLSKQAA